MSDGLHINTIFDSQKLDAWKDKAKNLPIKNFEEKIKEVEEKAKELKNVPVADRLKWIQDHPDQSKALLDKAKVVEEKAGKVKEKIESAEKKWEEKLEEKGPLPTAPDYLPKFMKKQWEQEREDQADKLTSLDELKKEYPDIYDKFARGFAEGILQQMQKDEEKIEAHMKEVRKEEENNQ